MVGNAVNWATSKDRMPLVWFSSCHIQTQALLSLRYHLACDVHYFPFRRKFAIVNKSTLCVCVCVCVCVFFFNQ